MKNIHKMFNQWRLFLSESVLNENISDITFKSDVDNAKTFVNFFVKSPETARIALEMLESSINDYQKLKSLSLDDDEYLNIKGSVLRSNKESLSDETIDKYVFEIENIIRELKSKYSL